MKSNLLSRPDLDAINSRGGDEMYASHAYLYAASCFQKQSLFGFQKWAEAEAAAELTHRKKLQDFCNNMGSEIEMYSTKAIEFKDETVIGILTFLFNMEKTLLEAYEKAWEEADRIASKSLFQEMVDIQVDGVGEVGDLIAEVESVGVGFVNQRLWH